MSKILISSRSFNRSSRSLEKLSKFELVFSSQKPTEEELLKLVDNSVVGIIAGTEKITNKLIDKCSNLKVISRYGSGLDNIDLDYVRTKNIKVCVTTKQNIAVAEFVIAVILNYLKKLNSFKNEWNPVYSNLLNGKIVGIVGYGRIGKEVEKRLEPFGVKILYHDECYVPYGKKTGLQEIFEYSDIVTIHLPLTKETHHLIGKPQFNMANKHLFLVNTSRGGIVDEDALYNALKNNQIAGAAVDVFEHEPYSGNLQKLDNIILTPHIASYSYETRVDMEDEAVNNLLEGLK